MQHTSLDLHHFTIFLSFISVVVNYSLAHYTYFLSFTLPISHHLTSHKSSVFWIQLTILLLSNKSLISLPHFIKSCYLGEISWSMLHLPKGSPISSVCIGTLNPIEYSPTVLIHFAFPLKVITYKSKWELWTQTYLLEERTHQQVKIQLQQESPYKQEKGQSSASSQGDQRDHTTKCHRIPTLEVRPTKTASKEHQEVQKQTRRVT